MGWPDFVFALHNHEELGPRMPARVSKHTGLRLGDSLAGCGKLVDSPGKWHAHVFLVIPAKAGIQAFQEFLDPGSPLRFGRDDG
jgi:hypothetical protein